MAVGVDAIAKSLNISPRRVQQLAKEGMPRVAPGKYEIGQCMAWYIRYLQKALEARATDGDGGSYLGLASQRTRLAREHADRAAMENAIRRGELVEVEVIGEVWSRLFKSIREKVLALPTKLAAELATLTDANVIRRRLTDEVHAILAEAAVYRPGRASADGRRAVRRGARAPEAAAGADGQPVG